MTRSEARLLLLLGTSAVALASLFAARPLLLATSWLAIWIADWALAARLGPTATSGGELLALTFVAGSFLLAATAVARSLTPLPLAACGMATLLAQWIWVVHRFPPRRPRAPTNLGADLSESLFYGCAMAVLLSIVGTVGLVIFALTHRGPNHLLKTVGLVVAAYFAGGLTAGLIVGLLRRLAGSRLGTVVLGFVGGLCVYGAAAPVVVTLQAMDNPQPTSVGMQLGTVMACALLLGPAVAFTWGRRGGAPVA